MPIVTVPFGGKGVSLGKRVRNTPRCVQVNASVLKNKQDFEVDPGGSRGKIFVVSS